jgi:hypothetical protein
LQRYNFILNLTQKKNVFAKKYFCNTTTTVEKGGQKNETEHCKNRDSPISPKRPAGEHNNQRRLPTDKNRSVATSLLGFHWRAMSAAAQQTRTSSVCVRLARHFRGQE